MSASANANEGGGVLTLPQLAAQTGASVDRLRDQAKKLHAEGLVFRVGCAWCCEAHRAAEVLAAVAPKPRGGKRT